MTIELKHKFQSALGDGLDSSQVQPSNWNDDHNLTMATGSVIGRSTAGAGAAEELPAGAFGLSILATATLADLQALFGTFSTGDAKLTFKNTADAGWILLDDGTIGKGGTSATTRANDDVQSLYVLIWDNVPDTYAPVTGGRGSSGALADFNAGKLMAMPKALGRALIIAGAGAGLTARTLGATFGEEKHILTKAELPATPSTGTISNGAISNSVTVAGSPAMGGNQLFVVSGVGSGGWVPFCLPQGNNIVVTSSQAPSTFSGGNLGSGTAHENTPAALGINIMVRL
jgi:hypothetical protein